MNDECRFRFLRAEREFRKVCQLEGANDERTTKELDDLFGEFTSNRDLPNTDTRPGQLSGMCSLAIAPCSISIYVRVGVHLRRIRLLLLPVNVCRGGVFCLALTHCLYTSLQ
jgi:hypothetical protein